MVRGLVDRYYTGVSRYTTSGFLRMKLGELLTRRGVAPHIFDRRGGAVGLPPAGRGRGTLAARQLTAICARSRPCNVMRGEGSAARPFATVNYWAADLRILENRSIDGLV